jgi:hypothetical protein
MEQWQLAMAVGRERAVGRMQEAGGSERRVAVGSGSRQEKRVGSKQ